MPRMNDRPRAVKGHGALTNPPPRFDLQQRAAVDDGWYRETPPERLETTVEPDRARGVITTNDSPDIPFDQSINPYRGCSHACPYCASPETPVLMADGTTRELGRLRVGDAIYGTERRGPHRRYVRSRVLAHWSTIKPAFRTTLEDGTTLVTSGDHRFLTERGWQFVTDTRSGTPRAHLTPVNKLVGTGAFARATEPGDDYRRGYLCGMIRGDGSPASYSCPRPARSHGNQYHFRLALCDREALVRTRNYLLGFDVSTSGFLFQAAAGACRATHALRTQSCWKAESIRALIAWPNDATLQWSAGFLAGIFDAGGSCGDTVVRIGAADREIVGWIAACLRIFDFKFAIEHTRHEAGNPIDVVRLTGALPEQLRFLHTVGPAISRKLDLAGQPVQSTARLRVAGVEPLGTMRLCDITTETGDFIANGVVSHNCYARPSHAWLGLSPGLDFETRLFYKADAARVLEEELSRPGYVCRPIMLGANTDPYQPLEKRLRVTRSILEVLARTRHPVAVVSKSALVLRDLDLLADLARDQLASVSLSVTTLDPDLKRVLEPLAASPEARLRTLEGLARAGVPAGVLVAPVIPALTDHELEHILAACAAAGARWAGYVLLRLPHEVKDLFREWLAEHYPERAAHVMALVRDMRGGRDNDPRFGSRMRGTGPYALLLRSRFRLAARRLGLDGSAARGTLDTSRFRPPGPAGGQLPLGL